MTPSAPAVVPFDLLPPEERPFFDRFGNGVVMVLPSQRPGPSGWGAGGPPHGGAWIHVGEDGKVRAFTGKVEVGQGTRTALSLVVAEELRVPLASVELTMGDTDVCPWDMGTFGSRSMPDAAQHLRATGAAMRAVLTKLAAERLRSPPETVELSEGVARVRGSGPEPGVALGELVRGLRRRETVSPETRPGPPTEWTQAGHPAIDVAARAIVTGRRQYTSDLRVPGMWHGKILYPPSYGARLRAVDLTAAKATPGVIVVQEGEFVGVAGPDLRNVWAAMAAIRADWETTPQPSEQQVFDYLHEHPAEGEDFWDVLRHETGDVAAAAQSAPVRLHATYTTAYIAHAPLETHAVIAAWQEDGRLTVWMGTQTPFRARESLSDALSVPPTSVHVIVPPTGSGFGGKHAAGLAVGAARLAKATGHPVRILFNREDEFTHAYFRPTAFIEVRSSASLDGMLTGWEFHVLNAGSAAALPPYRIPNQKVDNQATESPLPQGSYRALAATANNFARESHIDELASRVGADPVEYRLRHLADDRLATVLRAVADRVGWAARPSPTGRSNGPGRGIAVGLEKGGRIATFAEVSVGGDRRLEVVRVVSGYECGAIVHPSNLRSQVEGAAVMALGGALFESVHFENGRILNPKFSEYRVPRFHDVPAIEVMLLDRKDLPSQGGGETPLIAVAPAIASAIFDATGVRLRSLPLVPNGTVPEVSGVPGREVAPPR